MMEQMQLKPNLFIDYQGCMGSEKRMMVIL